MATVVGEGTLLADGTVQTVVSSALAATFQFMIRLNNLSGASDSVTIRIRSKIGSSGTMRTVYSQTFSDTQAAPNIVRVGPPLPSGWEYEVTLEQTGGTFRNFDWRLDAIGSLTVAGSGTQAIANTVETTVHSTADNATYVLAVDLGAMAATDGVTLRMRSPVLGGGTQEVVYDYTPTAAGAQSDPNILMLSLPLSGAHGVEGSIQQDHSNNRSYPWAMYKVAA